MNTAQMGAKEGLFSQQEWNSWWFPKNYFSTY